MQMELERLYQDSRSSEKYGCMPGNTPRERGSSARGRGIGLGKQDLEVLEVDGLHEVGVEAGLLGTAGVLLLAVASHRDEHDPAEILVLPASAGDLVAVHAGQADVEEDEVGPAAADQFEGGRAVVGHLDILAERAEEDAQAVGVGAVVVDDED